MLGYTHSSCGAAKRSRNPSCQNSRSRAARSNAVELAKHCSDVGYDENTAINIGVNSGISTEAAVAAATEILGNFAKTGFTKLDE
jgi:hypothetical protein